MLELAIIPKDQLATITSLFEELHSNDIVYCHWKSNEHLAASMIGDTDLDVLFDQHQKAKLKSLLSKLGFKKFNAIRQKQYKDIEDYLGLDSQSGKIIHVHTHYRLTMGEPYLKGYQLDFEEKILASRVFNEEYNLYCIAPAFELLLLYLRESLKLRHRDLLLMYLLNKVEYGENVLKEYRWLKARTNDSEIHDIIQSLFKDYALIYKLVIGNFNRRQLSKLAPIAKNELREKRLYAPVVALWTRWYREVSIITSRKLARILGRPILSKRINPRGGVVVAIIGADGSGKSSITKDLLKTFDIKLDVFKIYFGRGDGKISWGRKLLLSLGKPLKSKTSNTKDKKQNISINKKGFVATLYRCLEAILVAREKHYNLKLIQKAKGKGALVICDRFPQNQIMGYNDGPLLHHLLQSVNPLFKGFANWEAKTYARAEKNPPDILFKLIADADVVEKRKPGETSLEKLEAKIAGIKELKFNSPCKVITVDATKPWEEVLIEVKNEIWNIL